MFRHDPLSTFNFYEIVFYPIILAIGFEKCTLEIPNFVEHFFKIVSSKDLGYSIIDLTVARQSIRRAELQMLSTFSRAE